MYALGGRLEIAANRGKTQANGGKLHISTELFMETHEKLSELLCTFDLDFFCNMV